MNITASGRYVAGNISGIMDAIRGAATVAVVRTGDSVLQQAQVLVPIDTGALYDSGYRSEPSGESVEVGFTKIYAPFVEFGTFKMAAQPYLRPAMDSHHGVLMDETVSALKAVLA